MIAPLLALALAAAPAAPPPPTAPLAQEEWDDQWDEYDDGDAPRLFLTAWGGKAFDDGGGGPSSSIFGGEVAWAFGGFDLGLAGYGYRELVDAEREWTPVALVRLGQRFRTHRGVEAVIAIGLGAGRPDGWEAWYQLAVGGRASFGPLFLAGELSFEQYDLLRLAAGLGIAF